MNVYEKLRKLREYHGYTIKNIADFLGVDQQTVVSIENGSDLLTSDMTSRLTSLFGVQVSALLFDDEINAPKTVCAFRTSDLTAEDMRAIAQVNKIALNASFMTKLLEG